MTKLERDELLSMLKELAERANFLAGPRCDIPWQTVQDEDFIRARSLLKRYGVKVEYAHPPQELLDQRHKKSGKHPLCN